jgi:hypothetical protein
MSQAATQQVQIEDYNEQLVVTTPFQLLQWKHSLSLEMKGLTNSRGSVYSFLLKKLSAPKSFTIESMYHYISTCIESINEQLEVA